MDGFTSDTAPPPAPHRAPLDGFTPDPLLRSAFLQQENQRMRSESLRLSQLLAAAVAAHSAAARDAVFDGRERIFVSRAMVFATTVRT